MGRVISVNLSDEKGERKKPCPAAMLVPGHGLESDGHAGDWHRQVSLLDMASIEKMKEKGCDVGPGDFAENLTTEGMDLVSLPIGTRISVGDEAVLEVSQIGKVCHTHCAIYYQAGDCVMPKEGIFATVIEGGKVRPGDEIEVRDET